MLRAIETRYRGYRFRSRLEARWAVFFDALGIKWEYEIEGFYLNSGKYLPDFKLPFVYDRQRKQGVWVEIKGAEPTREENARCEGLCHSTGTSVILLVGPPPIDPWHSDGDGGYQWTYSRYEGEPVAMWDNCMALHYCTSCRSGEAAKFEFKNDYYSCPKCGGDECTYDNKFTRDAAERARSARFEYGEEG